MPAISFEPYFKLAFTTFSNPAAPGHGERILETWYEQYSQFTPEKMDYYEPVRQKVRNANEAFELWKCGDISWTRQKSPKGEGWMYDRTRFGYGGINMQFAAKRSINIESFFRMIATLGEADVGYLHLVTPVEFHRGLLSGEAAGDFRLGAFVDYVKNGLPNLGWLTVFSAKQSSSLGVVRLRDAGFSVEETDSGITFLKLTDNIWDVQDDFPRFDERRTKAKELIGLQYFRPWELHKSIEQMRAEAPPPPFLSPEDIERMRAKAAAFSAQSAKK